MSPGKQIQTSSCGYSKPLIELVSINPKRGERSNSSQSQMWRLGLPTAISKA